MDDDNISTLSDDSLLRDDSSSLDSDPNSLLDVSSDTEQIEVHALDSDYLNSVVFPDKISNINPSYSPSYGSSDFLCYFSASNYSDSGNPVVGLVFGSSRSARGYTVGFAELLPNGRLTLADTSAFAWSSVNGTLSSHSRNSYCLEPTRSPLFYGVTSLPSGGEYPTETILTLLSIVSFISIVWACFRIFIYPFYRRISK